MSPPYDRLLCPDIYLKKCERDIIDNWEGNIAKLTIEELAKKLMESVMLEEDDQFEPRQAVLPPPLVYNTRFPPIGLECLCVVITNTMS